MTTALVTGGAGFIGSHLVEALVAEGHRVRVLDDLSTGRPENLNVVQREIDFVRGDIRDIDQLHRVMKGVDLAFHQAAVTSVPHSVEEPISTHEVNATGTLNVLLAARKEKVRRMVYASSCAVYGDTPSLPKREDMLAVPQSPYAVSKLAGEHYCRVAWRVYGLSTVCLRYFNVFGPRQEPDSPYAAVIPRFLSFMKKGEPLPVYGDGKQTRDFVPISSVVWANLQAAEREGIDGEVFNIGSGNRVSILDLIDVLKQLTGESVRVDFQEERPGDVRDSWADIGKASQLLGFLPASLEAGLREMLNG